MLIIPHRRSVRVLWKAQKLPEGKRFQSDLEPPEIWEMIGKMGVCLVFPCCVIFSLPQDYAYSFNSRIQIAQPTLNYI